MWITWSPIAVDVASRWNVSLASVDALSSVFMWEYIPLSFPALWLLKKIGIRKGLLLGSIMNFCGAVIRWKFSFSYLLVYVGTVFCSTAQLFTLAVPPLLSHSFFAPNERALVTSIGVLANQLGTCAGLGATIIADLKISGALETYLQVQGLTALVALILILLFVNDGQHVEANEKTYLDSLKAVFSREGIYLNLVYALVVGVFYAVATFLGQLVNGWSPIDIGFLGISLVLGGVLGSSTSGVLLDRKIFEFPQMMRVLLIGSVLTSGTFACTLLWTKEHTFVFVATSFLGCFLTGVVSVAMEFGTRISPYVDEGIVAGVYNAFAQAGGCILVWLGSTIIDRQHGGLIILGTFIGTLMVSAVLFEVSIGSRKLADT